MDQNSVELSAECLVGTSGLFRTEPLGPDDAEKAIALPKEWRTKVVDWMDGKGRRQRRAKQVDYLGMWRKLTTRRDDSAVIAGIAEPAASQAYLLQLAKVRTHLRREWRPLSRSVAPRGTRILPPPLSEVLRASALYDVLSDPSVVVDSLASESLDSAQAVAFSEAYPRLFQMLTAIINGEADRRLAAKKSYEMTWPQERTLRILLALPSGQPLDAVPDEPPATDQAAVDIEIKKVDEMRTRGQTLAGASG